MTEREREEKAIWHIEESMRKAGAALAMHLCGKSPEEKEEKRRFMADAALHCVHAHFLTEDIPWPDVVDPFLLIQYLQEKCKRNGQSEDCVKKLTTALMHWDFSLESSKNVLDAFLER